MKGKCRFTLIELFIVITIITILLVILLPSLHRAKYKAKSVICLADKRQLFLNMLNHAKDNEGSVYNQQSVRVNNPWDYDHDLWYHLTYQGTNPWYLTCAFAERRPSLRNNEMFGKWGSMRDYSRMQDGYRIGVNIWTWRGSKGMWPNINHLGNTRINAEVSKWTSDDIIINDVHVTRNFEEPGSIHTFLGKVIELPTMYGDGSGQLKPKVDLSPVHTMNNNNRDWFWK